MLFGSEAGLVSSGSQYITGSERNGRLGAALAWGHFNSDTYGDLAIGIPGMTVGVSLLIPKELVFPAGAGQVSVRYGSENGFSGTSTQDFFQGTAAEISSAAHCRRGISERADTPISRSPLPAGIISPRLSNVRN